MDVPAFNPLATDTIVAVATPAGTGAVGLVRLSGPQAIALAQGLMPHATPHTWQERTLHLVQLHTAQGAWLDEALAVVFRAPRSYTHEDVVELNCHGSPYILRQVVQALVLAGARPAQPGEFTLRAFRAGALDLSQAEAVADLIAAESAQAHALAQSQLRGGYAQRLAQLREDLLGLLALVELELDFSEEDVEFASTQRLTEALLATQAEVNRLAESFSSGQALKEGIPTVIAGKPNAGKSTLLNRLLGEDRAMVSPQAGTTRDVVEDRLHLGGYLFRLMDTAGLRQAADALEAEGVRRSMQRLQQAAVVLYVYDASTESLAQAQAAYAALGLPQQAQVIWVANKTDLAPGAAPELGAVAVAAQLRLGLPQLQNQLVEKAQQAAASADVMVTHPRHAAALEASAQALAQAHAVLQSGATRLLLASDLRQALHHLGTITGQVTAHDVLGHIFSKFCIGK